jgi:NCS1 family nucleobase:cation symporter-1
LPALHVLAEFSWFIAAGLGCLFYYVLAPKGRTYADRDGEAIAVATAH